MCIADEASDEAVFKPDWIQELIERKHLDDELIINHAVQHVDVTLKTEREALDLIDELRHAGKLGAMVKVDGNTITLACDQTTWWAEFKESRGNRR